MPAMEMTGGPSELGPRGKQAGRLSGRVAARRLQSPDLGAACAAPWHGGSSGLSSDCERREQHGRPNVGRRAIEAKAPQHAHVPARTFPAHQPVFLCPANKIDLAGAPVAMPAASAVHSLSVSRAVE